MLYTNPSYVFAGTLIYWPQTGTVPCPPRNPPKEKSIKSLSSDHVANLIAPEQTINVVIDKNMVHSCCNYVSRFIIT